MGLNSDFLYMVCIIFMGFIVANIIMYLFSLGKGLVFSIKIKRAYKLLYDKHNPDEFLQKIDKLLLKNDRKNGRKNNSKEYIKTVLLLTKISGLFYKGDFDTVYLLLKSIDVSKLRGTQVDLYYNDLLYCLLLQGNINEANELYTANSYIFEQAVNNKKIGNSVKDTIATYEFFLGNIDQSERLFNELLDNKSKNLNLITIYYFLGLINISKGDTVKAMEYFEKVSTCAPYANFKEKAVEHLKKCMGEDVQKISNTHTGD